MAQFHFVEDYQKHVQNLISSCQTIDEAMSLAVGGGYLEIGQIEKDILLYAGMQPRMSIIDYGCGSGRLAHALPEEYNLNYLGIDIVDELLDYAVSKSPSNYKFKKHQQLNVPVVSESADIICVFSVFTHLLHHESYIYLEDMKRVLREGGIIIFSFLEFELSDHWAIFSATVEAQRNSTLPALNTFIEKSVIRIWAEKLNFEIIELINGNERKFGGKALGQSIAILKKRK